MTAEDARAGHLTICHECGQKITIPVAATELVAADDDQGPAAADVGGIPATGQTPAVGYTPETKIEPLDLVDVFSTTWTIFQNKMRVLVVGTLIVGVINFVFDWPRQFINVALQEAELEPGVALIFNILFRIIYGLVGVYLLCGSSLLMLNVAKGRPATVGDIFLGGRYVWRMSNCCLVHGVIVSLGFVACIVPGIILMLMFLPFALVLVDRDPRGLGALWQAREITDGHKPMLLVLGIVFLGLQSVGVSACCIGLLWTTPAAGLMITVAYLRMSGQKTVAG